MFTNSCAERWATSDCAEQMLRAGAGRNHPPPTITHDGEWVALFSEGTNSGTNTLQGFVEELTRGCLLAGRKRRGWRVAAHTLRDGLAGRPLPFPRRHWASHGGWEARTSITKMWNTFTQLVKNSHFGKPLNKTLNTFSGGDRNVQVGKHIDETRPSRKRHLEFAAITAGHDLLMLLVNIDGKLTSLFFFALFYCSKHKSKLAQFCLALSWFRQQNLFCY